ncbi:uncharacterized protein K452DRAFT_310394 [Aplosporella prunicola CBS 121167]|uniref:Uncharacterized protein n=1 Tax=Aplosporella prunicola CBS 121167 TaxID=1176127 RepID=A0A6A6B807_9PEZI|nr:uncharacterized protein K452DRAFT_310394 [Aplosporella prunicola CBS 121167]KAF2140046.1 hypothetical protein K452DRAFT_310394 [Aplosporella prunicola CBS 121167]
MWHAWKFRLQNLAGLFRKLVTIPGASLAHTSSLALTTQHETNPQALPFAGPQISGPTSNLPTTCPNPKRGVSTVPPAQKAVGGQPTRPPSQPAQKQDEGSKPPPGQT